MPISAETLETTSRQSRLGKYCVIQAETLAHGLLNLGVLLEDPETDSLRLRFRRDLESLAPLVMNDEALEVLSALADDLAQKAQELGAGKLFEYLEGTLSGAIRVTDREEVLVSDFDRALNRLYLENVQSNVLEFRTHLPRYSLKAAAGKFLENQEVTQDSWIEAPEDLRLGPDMFVAEIAGHSMEPRIPDGSLCVFRYGVVGSRIGRLVLALERGAAGDDRYAVKRYHRDPTKSERMITLQSLNHAYPDWNLDPDEEKYRILAEFVRVLD
jgi:phage repressor protein C with HTH and peptisase S24 domain